jgi:hypothetical protein
MGQLGFFDMSRRYEGLDVKDDPLWRSRRCLGKRSLP